MRIDVALLLYDRPDHAGAVLDSLESAGVRRVRAFMDRSDHAEVRERQEQMVQEVAARQRLEVDLFRHAKHLGLARSVRHALDATLAEADAVILLEDDCVLRPGALEFFEQGLTALRYDRRIRSLCGYLFPCPFVRSGSEPLLLRRFCTWGWGGRLLRNGGAAPGALVPPPRPAEGRLASRAALICSGVLRSGSESLTRSFARATWRLCRFASFLSIPNLLTTPQDRMRFQERAGQERFRLAPLSF
jgi:hypothetical protein